MKFRSRTGGAAGALALLLITCGAAEAAEPGFYLGATLGQSIQDAQDSNGTVINFAILGGLLLQVYPDSVEVDDDKWSWDVTLGYRVNDYFAAELAYMDLGGAEIRETYRIPAPFGTSTAELIRTMSSAVMGPAVSVLGSLPFHERFAAFLRAGVLFADREIVQRYTSGSQSWTFGSETWIGGVGAQWTFATRWTARLEYLRTGTVDANLIAGETELEQFAISVLFKL